MKSLNHHAEPNCGYRVFVCDNMAFHGEYAPATMFPNSQQDIRRKSFLGVARERSDLFSR